VPRKNWLGSGGPRGWCHVGRAAPATAARSSWQGGANGSAPTAPLCAATSSSADGWPARRELRKLTRGTGRSTVWWSTANNGKVGKPRPTSSTNAPGDNGTTPQYYYIHTRPPPARHRAALHTAPPGSASAQRPTRTTAAAWASSIVVHRSAAKAPPGPVRQGRGLQEVMADPAVLRSAPPATRRPAISSQAATCSHSPQRRPPRSRPRNGGSGWLSATRGVITGADPPWPSFLDIGFPECKMRCALQPSSQQKHTR
jgi:hypothetical protein